MAPVKFVFNQSLMMSKITTSLVVLLITAVLLACATQQQKAERTARTQETVAEAIAKKQWHIDITSMNTLRYGARTVTPDFYLELHGDTLRSYLPYLGQVHQAPMLSPSQGLNFEAPVSNYQERRPKAHRLQIDFDVRTQEDSYHFTVEVYPTGKSSIHVRPLHRDPVSFDGDMIN